MKKLIYLFLTALIVACSSDDGGSVSFVGNWQLNSISENGVDIHDSCDLESYMVLTETNTGGFYQFYSDDPATEPCGLDVVYSLTWSQVDGSNYQITDEFGTTGTAVLTNVLTLYSNSTLQIIFTKN